MLAAKLATKLVGSNSFTKSLVQEYFSLHFPFFFVGGEHWLSPPCSVARAQLLPTCTVPGKLFSVQGWRGRGTQVLQAWEPEELTALRKVFATIMMTIRMMIISITMIICRRRNFDSLAQKQLSIAILLLI